MSLRGQVFHRVEEEEKVAWQREGNLQNEVLPTHWAVKDDRCLWVTPESGSLSWRDRIQSFWRTGHWPKEGPPSPRIVRLTREAKEFEIIEAGLRLLAVRVPDDFEIPDEPLTPEKALAWWQEKKEGRSAPTGEGAEAGR